MTRSNRPAAADNSDKSPLAGTALGLGLIGAGMALLAIALMLFGSEELNSPVVGVLIRVGAVLLALSFVLTTISKPSPRVMVVAGISLALVLVRPALIWVAVVGWLGWAVYRRIQSRTEASDS